MLRYIKRLEAKDLSLCHSMISLGSCTMKLNAASEMLPGVLAGVRAAASLRARGADRAATAQLFRDLEAWLAEITGFAAVSLQPNAGSQGEYAGLLVIRAYHESRGEGRRNVCLIPTSAHGTNPASAAMCGFKVVPVACDAQGNIDVADLDGQGRGARGRPGRPDGHLSLDPRRVRGLDQGDLRASSTRHGGQVYMDGANMNAQVGLTSPGHIGADVCHLNLHKTFCIPHGGGGPGMGPIGVAAHLAPFLPGHAVVSPFGNDRSRAHLGAVSAGPVGQRQHPRHLLDVHPHDGPGRPDGGDQGRDPERELRRQAPGEVLPRPLPRRRRASSPTSASSTCAAGRSTASRPRTPPSA